MTSEQKQAIREVFEELKSLSPEEFKRAIEKAANYREENFFDNLDNIDRIVKKGETEFPEFDTVRMLRES